MATWRSGRRQPQPRPEAEMDFSQFGPFKKLISQIGPKKLILKMVLFGARVIGAVVQQDGASPTAKKVTSDSLRFARFGEIKTSKFRLQNCVLMREVFR